MPTRELYNELKPIRAEQMLLNAINYLDGHVSHYLLDQTTGELGLNPYKILWQAWREVVRSQARG